MPATWDTLRAVLVGEGKTCQDDRALDGTLTELEDRGLIGWDKRANRYDMHPIVRRVVWSGLGDDLRRGVYTNLHAHFEALPKIEDYLRVGRVEDLTPDIELYNSLIGLGRYDDAEAIFSERFGRALHFRLSAARHQAELVEMLFPDGLDKLPRLSNPQAQAFTLSILGQAYSLSGQPGRAQYFLRRANKAYQEMNRTGDLGIGLGNLSTALRPCGAVYEAERVAREGVLVMREQGDHYWEAVNQRWLGNVLAARGSKEESTFVLQRSLRVQLLLSDQSAGLTYFCLAESALWFAAFADAHSYADRAWGLAGIRNYERDIVRAARIQGAAALGLGDFAVADERLHHALTRARQVNQSEEELPALITLAELRYLQCKPDEAREYLDDVWDAAERGPFLLFHADAFNVLAQIERDAGNLEKAIAAATQAYRLAWCDGPPFAYHWGLVAAQKHLQDLGAPEPEMPPFDESKFEPMPEVEIDPDDEFHSRPDPVDQ
jgi:tetratricopeptide (TPR) repeat protein